MFKFTLLLVTKKKVHILCGHLWHIRFIKIFAMVSKVCR